MELDFSSVGVDIWFLPHVRYVVLSNYSLYSSIRWSPAVVIGHRILRLDCCWCFFFLAYYFLDRHERVLLNYTRITFDFYTLSKESQIDFVCICKMIKAKKKNEKEMNISLPLLFSNRKKKEKKREHLH